jgi:hypothetical protein
MSCHGTAVMTGQLTRDTQYAVTQIDIPASTRAQCGQNESCASGPGSDVITVLKYRNFGSLSIIKL